MVWQNKSDSCVPGDTLRAVVSSLGRLEGGEAGVEVESVAGLDVQCFRAPHYDVDSLFSIMEVKFTACQKTSDAGRHLGCS